MAWSKPKFSKKEVSQRFNLKDLLGREPTDAEKSAFIERAIDFMVARTKGNADVSGNPFTPYSKEYAKEKGVSPNSVNMTLSGSMLASIDFVDMALKNVVKIAVDEDESPKAFNHNTGDTLPRRKFFGLRRKDAEIIARSIKGTVDESPEVGAPRTVGEALDAVGGVSSLLTITGTLNGEGDS